MSYTVVVNVMDANDNVPIFQNTPYEIAISEVGISIATVASG